METIVNIMKYAATASLFTMMCAILTYAATSNNLISRIATYIYRITSIMALLCVVIIMTYVLYISNK